MKKYLTVGSCVLIIMLLMFFLANMTRGRSEEDRSRNDIPNNLIKKDGLRLFLDSNAGERGVLCATPVSFTDWLSTTYSDGDYSSWQPTTIFHMSDHNKAFIYATRSGSNGSQLLLCMLVDFFPRTLSADHAREDLLVQLKSMGEISISSFEGMEVPGNVRSDFSRFGENWRHVRIDQVVIEIKVRRNIADTLYFRSGHTRDQIEIN